MSKSKASKGEAHTKKLNKIVDTENEFAAEFGEGLYGGQAREAFVQQQMNKNKKASK